MTSSCKQQGLVLASLVACCDAEDLREHFIDGVKWRKANNTKMASIFEQ
jgi:hypothetical protein